MAAPQVIPYTKTAFVMITAYIEPNIPGREVAERWVTAIIQSLVKLHTEDKAVCLLQPDNIEKGRGSNSAVTLSIPSEDGTTMSTLITKI